MEEQKIEKLDPLNIFALFLAACALIFLLIILKKDEPYNNKTLNFIYKVFVWCSIITSTIYSSKEILIKKFKAEVVKDLHLFNIIGNISAVLYILLSSNGEKDKALLLFFFMIKLISDGMYAFKLWREKEIIIIMQSEKNLIFVCAIKLQTTPFLPFFLQI